MTSQNSSKPNQPTPIGHPGPHSMGSGPNITLTALPTPHPQTQFVFLPETQPPDGVRQKYTVPPLNSSGNHNQGTLLNHQSVLHTELSVINLTPNHFTAEENEVLRLGLSFCPAANIDRYETIKDVYLFACNLTFK